MIRPLILKKILLMTVLAVVLSLSAGADDGSWSKSFSVAGGSIYSEEDNSEIVLEKELLIFNGRTTEAFFLFKNTSNRKITLTCGFPVIQKIDTYMRDGYAEIPLSRYGGGAVPGIVFFETSVNPELDDDEPMFVYPEVIPVNSFNNSREFIGAEIPKDIGIKFSIEQDGKSVLIEDILLEREVNEDFASLTFHFKHQLELAANGSSVVTVRYSQDLLSGNDGGMMSDVFNWNYVIGTGGTWKEAIGEFYFIKPVGWDGEPSGMKRVNHRIKDGIDIYYAENYEPERTDEFSLRSQPVSMMDEFSLYSDFPYRKAKWTEKELIFPFLDSPAQSFVTSISASSSLPGTIDVFADDGVIESAEFSPFAAFDGFTETSWCENVKGTGEGEYLEVELTESAAGLVISNGFKRFTIDDWVFEGGYFENMVRDDKAGLKDYFTMNSRIKTLEVDKLDSSLHVVIQLADQRDPQTFFGINLEPGTYRFTIGETYPGTKWEDTCLAEITFIPNETDGMMSELFADRFFRQIITMERYEK